MASTPSNGHSGDLANRLDALRTLPGYPRGGDAAILRLSDPPSYTACPNPFLTAFVESVRTPQRQTRRAPYTGDLAASVRHPVYNFHSYHTKAPPQAIRRLIEHYTDPGDLVLDAFSGSGMTGVAAREAGRNAILIDLAPIAAFVSSINGRAHDTGRALALLRGILRESEERWGHLYRTDHDGRTLEINYVVWSDVFACPECATEFPFFPSGVVHTETKVSTRPAFPCPGCACTLTVRRVRRVLTERGKKKALVWVNAGRGKARVRRPPTPEDLARAAEAEALGAPPEAPSDLIDPDAYSARLAQLGNKRITDVSRFLSDRNRIVFTDLWRRVGDIDEPALRNLCWATLTASFTVVSERQGYFGGGGGMSGNLYMPIVRMERNVYHCLRRKLNKLKNAEALKAGLRGTVFVSTQSATDLSAIPSASVDYVYTDPPFGANIIYSELNQVLEAWLGVKTNADVECVIDSSRGRDLADYGSLLAASFQEYRRVLKPGAWLTVEFHNTQASVWNTLQRIIGESGFVIGQVGVLDKGSTTILSDIRPGATKGDLLISAYKPTRVQVEQFELAPGSEDSLWAFVEEHVRRLPAGSPELGKHLLFDRVVAFHLQRGVRVPLSAAEFYTGWAKRGGLGPGDRHDPGIERRLVEPTHGLGAERR